MTPLEAAWEHYGGTLLTHREGRNKARCPLHDDANASAVVNILEQRWSCFAGCGYGDIYELIKLAEGIESFPECMQIAERSFAATREEPARGRKRGKKRSGGKKAWL